VKSSATSATDRRFRIGLAISLGSLLLIGVGLFAVVSAITGSDVKLPSEGSIQDIVGNGSSDPQANNGGQAVQPTQFPSGPKPTRVAIQRIYVDAPVIQMGLEPGTDIPDVPDRGDQVAWYDFNPVPGIGYNAVFSGHVDWQTAAHSPIPGVFYRLRELQIGDEITVTLEDGQVLAYRVTGNVAAAWDDPNIVKAMQPVQKDVITILTCGGSWEPNPREENGGNYTHRIVVRAERVVNAAG
jgi:LPXTG-site transpeptidase (sortase) family protein